MQSSRISLIQAKIRSEVVEVTEFLIIKRSITLGPNSKYRGKNYIT